jgi:HK97 family phage major capsid protein
MMLGAPVRYDENMPDVAAGAFPIAYGDFTTALRIVNRRGMTVIRDDLSVPGQVKFNIDRRLGAGLVNFEAIKLLKIAAS